MNGTVVTLLRVLPGTSPLRRAWAGTKLVALVVVAVALVALPGWGAVAAVAALVAVAAVGARLPLSVVPRPPVWLVAILAISGATAAIGGGLVLFVQGLVIAFGLVALGLLVTWTTPVVQLGPAFAVLTAPLARLGLPTRTWSATIALTVRTLPLIVEDLQTIGAVHRLRRRRGQAGRTVRARTEAAGREVLDLAVTAVSVTARRGRDVALAVAARGGVALPEPPRPRLGAADLAVGACTVAAVCGALLLR